MLKAIFNAAGACGARRFSSVVSNQSYAGGKVCNRVEFDESTCPFVDSEFLDLNFISDFLEDTFKFIGIYFAEI
jgi:hypothetical protein